MTVTDASYNSKTIDIKCVKNDSGIRTGAIIGTIVGVSAGIVLIIVSLFCIKKVFKKKKVDAIAAKHAYAD